MAVEAAVAPVAEAVPEPSAAPPEPSAAIEAAAETPVATAVAPVVPEGETAADAKPADVVTETRPAEPEVILGATEYGHSFCSVVARDNIVATQFHAEKSGQLGLRLLENFARWDGRPC